MKFSLLMINIGLLLCRGLALSVPFFKLLAILWFPLRLFILLFKEVLIVFLKLLLLSPKEASIIDVDIKVIVAI